MRRNFVTSQSMSNIEEIKAINIPELDIKSNPAQNNYFISVRTQLENIRLELIANRKDMNIIRKEFRDYKNSFTDNRDYMDHWVTDLEMQIGALQEKNGIEGEALTKT